MTIAPSRLSRLTPHALVTLRVLRAACAARAARAVATLTVAALAVPAVASAQHVHHDSAAAATAPITGRLGAQAIAMVTRATPAHAGRTRTEGYLTQPSVMGHLALLGGRLATTATLNLEGLTLARGELNTGIYGEGYIDRRHPHTYLHELMASGVARLAGTDVSLSVGKGFVPFGTDDPMTRPFPRYPVNHHLAQILERAQVVVGTRRGPLLLEGATFNGDEPNAPGDTPNVDRFADSWAARATLLPLAGVELQGSRAWVRSPELAAGGGSDQRKTSASLRVSRPRARGAPRYALVEWARTVERAGGRPAFALESALAEGLVGWRGVEWGARLERTTRPEEERLLDPFRSARPHTDASILGVTRFTSVGALVARPVRVRRAGVVAPFVEAVLLHAKETERPSAFVPERFYGAARVWNVSAGLRLQAGGAHGRMGRYGVAADGHGPHERRRY